MNTSMSRPQIEPDGGKSKIENIKKLNPFVSGHLFAMAVTLVKQNGGRSIIFSFYLLMI